MNKGTRFAGFELIHLLVLVTAAELAFNRLATRELRPNGDIPPPWWHQIVDHIGLFSQYFAATLAAGIIAYEIWRVATQGLYFRAARYPLVLAGSVFATLGCLALVVSFSADMGFVFETAFIITAVALLAAQMTRGGDMGVKIGLVLLITPLVVHYYGVVAIRIEGEEALWSGLPERVLDYGQWTLIVAALLSPYCFAPRPLLESLIKPAPIVIATLISVLGVILLRQYYMVAMRLAENWLGLDIGPGAPLTSLFTYAFAMGTMTWTLVACITADSVARRDIGVGIGLIVLSGYGFAWPVHFLVTMVGLMTIADGIAKVVTQEGPGGDKTAAFLAPPIAEAVWRGYASAVADELGRAAAKRVQAQDRDTLGAPVDDEDRDPGEPESESLARMDDDGRAERDGRDGRSDDQDDRPDDAAVDEPAATVSILFSKGPEPGYVYTHLVMRVDEPWQTVRVRIERYNDSVVTLEVDCGDVPTAWDEIEPAWTLFARPEKLLGIGSHPEPPATSAPVYRVPDDSAFEHRFRVRDAGGHTDMLLDHTLRARASALVDGWIAFWPGRGLRYCVHPGRGAPLDHPIPITEMAFRGSASRSSANRLVAVIELLALMAERGLGESV